MIPTFYPSSSTPSLTVMTFEFLVLMNCLFWNLKIYHQLLLVLYKCILLPFPEFEISHDICEAADLMVFVF